MVGMYIRWGRHSFRKPTYFTFLANFLLNIAWLLLRGLLLLFLCSLFIFVSLNAFPLYFFYVSIFFLFRTLSQKESRIDGDRF